MAKAKGRIRVISARAGTLRGGRFTPAKRRNIAAGFHDEEGIFHPIRASYDYDSSRGDDRPRKGKARKKKAAAAKPARKRAKPVKKAKARKKRSR
jgi:hypothetical protein